MPARSASSPSRAARSPSKTPAPPAPAARKAAGPAAKKAAGPAAKKAAGRPAARKAAGSPAARKPSSDARTTPAPSPTAARPAAKTPSGSGAKATSPQSPARPAPPTDRAPARPSARSPARPADGASGPDGLPILSFADAEAFGAWLTENHGSASGGWLRMARKGTTEVLISYALALDVALCWGWIDGQRRSLDEVAFLQKFTPRRARSIWSQVNRDKALALIASGAMRPPGMAEIERARHDGRWDAAYSPASRSEVPADLASALDATPGAAAFFASLDARNRYAILFRLQTARTPDLRARRLADFVAMCGRGERLHQP